MALYTPALPTLTDVFETTSAVAKLTLTVYFAGFTVAQLICGPLSDAYGRRPVILGFFSLYLVGSLMAWFAPNIETLLLSRLIQGIGASSGVAVARALVRDQFSGEAGARIMNLLALMLGIAPAFSPTIGALVLGAFGLQAVFLLMVVYAACILVLTLTVLPETNLYRDAKLIQPRYILSSYWTLLKSFEFLRPSLILGLTIGVIYTMSTILPFVLIDQLGLSPCSLVWACCFSPARSLLVRWRPVFF